MLSRARATSDMTRFTGCSSVSGTRRIVLRDAAPTRMKLLVCLAVLVGHAAAFAPLTFQSPSRRARSSSRGTSATANKATTVDDMLEEAEKAEFASWKQEFEKNYASGAEEEAAFANFAANARLSKTMNAILKQPATRLSERSDKSLVAARSAAPKTTARTVSAVAKREKAIKEAARKRQRFAWRDQGASKNTKAVGAEEAQLSKFEQSVRGMEVSPTASAPSKTKAAAATATVDEMLKEADKAEFASWKQEFGKKYASGAEEETAFANFAANARLSKTMNAILKQPATRLCERSDQPLPTLTGAKPAAATGKDDAARKKAEEVAKMLQAKALEEAKVETETASPPDSAASVLKTDSKPAARAAAPAPSGFAKNFPRTTRLFRALFGRGQR